MLATQFINGVLEGDGYSSAKGRGHLGITTNKKEALILNEIMPFTGLNFNYRIEGGNRASIILHSTSLLTNILRLKDDIFKYYPKRRKRFIERFLNTGSAKFLIGKQDYASGWVKAHLVKEGILDEDYNLTKKGKNIRKSLMELTKNVAVK
jgi:hypothetical protein